MNRLRLLLGILWASPVTLASFIFYIAPLWALRKYKYAGWTGLAWRWDFTPKKPLYQKKLDKFLDEKWRRWAGSTVGNIIVMKVTNKEPREMILVHEHEHVIQLMRLGIFQPILYGMFYLVAKYILRSADPYYDNPFEIDARRAANQLVDIPGTVKRIQEAVKNKQV